jgi:photosystem II stability/assembly factor-like uncharacterized protein
MKTVSCCLLFLLFNSFIFAQQWTSLGLNSETISSIAVDWANPNIIYAGSSSNFSSGTTGGIFKSTNGGATWDTLIRGVTVRQIVVHPKSSNIIYATLGVNVLTSPGIIKTTDAGKSWQGVDSGLMLSWEEGVSQLAIDPEHPDTLYCGMAGLEGGKFYRSIDGGKNWNSLGDTTALSNGVVSVAIDPDSSNVIFAGTEGIGNILKSTDYGVNWILTGLVNVGIIYSIEFVKGTSTIYSAASSDIVPVGVFKSTDGGKTWSNPKTGLPNYVSGSNIQIASNGTV